MAIEDKLKMAQLMVEASYMEEKQSALFKAQKLKQEEELAKLKARSKFFDEMQIMSNLMRMRKTCTCLRKADMFMIEKSKVKIMISYRSK